jgi:hypothetical protein
LGERVRILDVGEYHGSCGSITFIGYGSAGIDYYDEHLVSGIGSGYGVFFICNSNMNISSSLQIKIRFSWCISLLALVNSHALYLLI